MRVSFLIGAAAAALASASTLTPPVLPLIVRNPYLSTWVRSRDPPWERWPIFWTGNSVSARWWDPSGQKTPVSSEVCRRPIIIGPDQAVVVVVGLVGFVTPGANEERV